MKRELTEAFNRIKTETGVGSLQELLGAYLTEEETNFEAYQLINRLNAELDSQESAKTAMVGEIAEIEQRLREQGKALSSANSAKIADETEKTRRLKETLKVNYRADLKVIADVEEAMISLVNTLMGGDGGHVDTVGELLVKGGVSEGTLAKFLGYIEGKMTALIQIADEEGGDDVTKAPMPKIGADGVRECSIEMPVPPSTTEDVDEMEEESPKPVNVQAIKESLVQAAERTDGGGDPNDPTVRSASVRSNRKMSRSGSNARSSRKMSMGGAKGLNYMQGSPKHRNSLLNGGTSPSQAPPQGTGSPTRMADRSTSHGSLNNM
mmetsp:Transcript_26740/g.71795  ORF Transcript_26740/g.71795 Transcript_26740/m.71795 type:complete len:323 (+) Transcript_26740:938-1906(+)